MISISGSSALSPKEKAAVLLVSLGKEYSAELYKHLSAEEIDELTQNAAFTGRLSAKVRERVVKEFYELCLARKLINDGGIDYARGILEEALGRTKADTLLFGQPAALHDVPFERVQDAPLECIETSDVFSVGLPEISNMSNMFAFEDITRLTGSSIRRALRDIPSSDLAIALKLSSKDVLKAVFSNVSRSVQDKIKSEMEQMGPVRVQDAQDARRRIVGIIRNLEDEGEIEIVRDLQAVSIA